MSADRLDIHTAELFTQLRARIAQLEATEIELHRQLTLLTREIKGPDGFETWKDAAVDQRLQVSRLTAENATLRSTCGKGAGCCHQAGEIERLTAENASLREEKEKLSAHLNVGCTEEPGGQKIKLDYLTAELPDGRSVQGCFHEDSYWWRFVNKGGDVTRLRVTPEAMQEMAMMYVVLLRGEVDEAARPEGGK